MVLEIGLKLNLTYFGHKNSKTAKLLYPTEHNFFFPSFFPKKLFLPPLNPKGPLLLIGFL